MRKEYYVTEMIRTKAVEPPPGDGWTVDTMTSSTMPFEGEEADMCLHILWVRDAGARMSKRVQALWDKEREKKEKP